MGILVTGFEPFGGAAENPSQDLALALADVEGRSDVTPRSAVLPVAYERVAAELDAALGAPDLDAVILLGVHDGTELRLERNAKNWDGSASADNDGVVRTGSAILQDAPASYGATLPIPQLQQVLSIVSVPHVVSDDAGGFLCNHAFYRVLHRLSMSGRSVACGFIHVPAFQFVSFEAQLVALRQCLRVIEHQPTPRVPSRREKSVQTWTDFRS